MTSNDRASLIDRRIGGMVGARPQTPDDAVRILDNAPPDSVRAGPRRGASEDDLALIDRARAVPDGDDVPIVCVLDRKHRRLTLDAFGRRADDVVTSGHPIPTS